MTEKNRYEINKRLRMAEGEMVYHLDCFGDFLATRENYKEHSGMDAVIYYLCMKMRWTPERVRSMHPNDVRFLLAEEMHGWTLPREAVF